jgi:hypothetical protein
MRYGEDNYENNFLDDFSGYGGYGGLPATTYTAPVATYTPPAATYTAPMGGLPVPPDDDYTGRMGPDGEPERYSTMLGGDPRIKQQQELAERERRLKEPFSIDNWLKSGNKDVRGTTAASQITLNPGTKYQIRDYSGKNDGQIIASGSTPEEFLMMQDIARGLARQGTNADYRLEQVGGEAPQNFGQYRDPATGEVVSLLGGDLYNKPIAGDIIKIALPLALNVIPGLGLGAALGGKLGLSGLAAKAAGVGLTSALGRTGAGILTGDPVLDSLKAGAITGLASGATAGLLGATGVDKAISGALGSAKGALTGETVGQGISEAAKKAAEEGLITVVGSRIAPAVLGGLSSAGGSLLGDIGKSIDPFQQALDQARLDNEFGLGDTVVTGTRDATTASPLTGALSGASDAIKYIVDPSEVAGQTAETRIDETPADKEIVVSNTTTPPAGLDTVLTTGAGALNLGTPPIDTTLPGEELLAETTRLSDDRLTGPLTAATTTLASTDTTQIGDEPTQTVTARRNDDISLGGNLDLRLPIDTILPGATLAKDAGVDKTPEEKKDGVLSKINPVRAGLSALAGLVSLLGGGGGGGRGVPTGNAGAGTRASLDPRFSAKLPAASPQYSGMSLAPRDMSGVDFARYGYGPGASFFENVPRNPEEYRAALAANTPTARPSSALNLPPVAMPQTETGATADPTATATSLIRTYIPSATDAEITEFLATEEGMQFLANFGPPVRRARGGSMRGTGTSRNSYAVKGAGTGRSDEIPALLSDGEYVMDAETVAMLGDGSSEAGAKRLDDFRINVRKHKGRNLAKGKFSANAKRPEKYLTGGRA